MAKIKVLNQTPITLTEVKADLDKIKKNEEDLNFRSNKTHEYVHQLNLLSKKDVSALKKELAEIGISRLKDEYIVKIIDSLPLNTPEQVKQLFQGYPLTLSAEDVKKILDIVAKYM